MIKSFIFIAVLTAILCLSVTLKNAGGGIENRCNTFLKGLCALLIMLHHAVSIFGTTYLWFFKFTGYVTTAIFFGLSGYGLTVQLQQGKYSDIVLFQKKRLKTILIPFSLACVIYLCMYKLLGVAIDVNSWFSVGQPIHQNFWYIIALLYLYEVFALVCIKYKKDNTGLIWVGISLVIYMVLILFAGYGSHWYNSIFAFLVGMYFGLNPIIKIKNLHILNTLITFGAFFLSKIVADYLGYKTVAVVLACLSSVFFFCFMYLLFSRIQCKDNKVSKVFLFMGKISYELYLYHGIVFLSVLKLMDSVNNDYKTVIAFVITFVIASIMNRIDLLILKR